MISMSRNRENAKEKEQIGATGNLHLPTDIVFGRAPMKGMTMAAKHFMTPALEMRARRYRVSGASGSVGLGGLKECRKV
jgi:hypothetical protein